MARESATGGGDCRTEVECATNMPLRSFDVPGGVISGVEPSAVFWLAEEADGERRCRAMYEAERGSAGLVGVEPEEPAERNDDLREASGEGGAEEAGER
jgi:hypothetical protein